MSRSCSVRLAGCSAGKAAGRWRTSTPASNRCATCCKGARAEIDGQVRELGPGDVCFFPADMVHVFTRISEEPVRVLVIYSPPYGESKEKGIAA